MGELRDYKDLVSTIEELVKGINKMIALQIILIKVMSKIMEE
jgi:hypothetical protein